MTSLHDTCSHGKTWSQECVDCAAISENETLQHCAGMALRAAAFYEENPGYVQPATIVDLYRAVSRIALIADAINKEGRSNG